MVPVIPSFSLTLYFPVSSGAIRHVLLSSPCFQLLPSVAIINAYAHQARTATLFASGIKDGQQSGCCPRMRRIAAPYAVTLPFVLLSGKHSHLHVDSQCRQWHNDERSKFRPRVSLSFRSGCFRRQPEMAMARKTAQHASPPPQEKNHVSRNIYCPCDAV